MIIIQRVAGRLIRNSIVALLVVNVCSCADTVAEQKILSGEIKGDQLEIPRELIHVNHRVLCKNKGEIVARAIIVKPRVVSEDKIGERVRIACFSFLPEEKNRKYKISSMYSPSRVLVGAVEESKEYDEITIVIMATTVDGLDLPPDLKMSISAFGYQQIVLLENAKP